MSKPQHQRGIAPSYPLWIRWVAAACLLLCSVVGTAQATHIHGKVLPNQKLELHQLPEAGQTLGGEEHCPLCVAMHSAALTESAAPLPYGPVIAFRLRAVERPVAARETHWHFARFSRPPPALA